MPSPEQLEYARVLLRKAASDLAAARLLTDSAEVADEAIGFHAQQAAEKALKAVLVADGIEIPRTHDLDYLLEQIERAGREPPSGLGGAAWLSPWAVQFRYDEPLEPLDRSAALELAAAALEWARTVVQETRT